MKKIAKKLLAVLLCVCMVIPFASCGKETASADVPTLIWYIPGAKTADLELINEEVNKIVEPKIGARIDMEFIDDAAYPDKMTMNMASKNQFDICFTGYINKYPDAVNRGGFMDITEYVEKSDKLKEAIPEYAWDATRINGKIYAVPNQQTFTQTNGIAFRKDLVEKYNFDISKVKNIRDVEPFLQQIKENEKDYYPVKRFKYEFLTSDKYEPINDFSSLVFMKRDGSHEIVPICDIPEVKEFIDISRDWYLKGYYRPDVATVGNENPDVYLGKYAVWPVAWKPGVLEEEGAKMPDVEIVGVNMVEPYLTRFFSTATMYAVSATSKNPEKAVKFLELLNTDKELYNLICWGIEGKHYEKLDGEYIKLIPESGYVQNASWKFGNCFNSYILEGQPEDLWEITKKENDTAKQSEIVALAFDNAAVRTELANCAAIISEYMYMYAGYQDPEESFKKYKNRLEEAGIYKIVEEAQKQVDEFFKNK